MTLRLVTIAVLATSCATEGLRRIPLSALHVAPQLRPESVYVRLTDGTQYTLDGPYFLNGDLAGQMRDCEGPACELLCRNGCVGPAAVQTLAVWGPVLAPEPPRVPEPPPASWPRVGGGVGTTLMYLYSSRVSAAGLGLYGRIAARFRRAVAVELEVTGGTLLLSWALRGALTVVVTPASWVSVATGLSVQRAESTVGGFFHSFTRSSTAYTVPIELCTHWLGSPTNGTGHGVEFTLGADLGVATSRSEAPIFAVGGHVGIGYGWR